MLLVTNRPSVYVLIKGETVELEVDKPTPVSDDQGAKLIRRGICMAYVEPEIKLLEGETGETMDPVAEVVDSEPEPDPAKKSAKKK